MNWQTEKKKLVGNDTTTTQQEGGGGEMRGEGEKSGNTNRRDAIIRTRPKKWGQSPWRRKSLVSTTVS